MQKYQVETEQWPPRVLHGVQKTSCERSMRREIAMMKKLYARLTGRGEDSLYPLYAVSWAFSSRGACALFVGGAAERDGINDLPLKEGLWARIRLEPGFMGCNIKKAKRWFYAEWLEANPFDPLGMECIRYNAPARGRKDPVDLLFAVRQK